jgi:hypothetical protein
LLKKKVFVYLRPVYRYFCKISNNRKGFKRCPDKKEHTSPQRGREKINMGSESVCLPLTEEKLLLEEEQKEERS